MSDNDNNVTDYFTSYIENNNIKRTKLGKLNNDVNEFASLLQSVNNSTLNKEDIIEVYPLDKDIQITDNNNKEEERKDVQVVLCDDDFGGTLNASYRNNEESILPERIELIRDDTINHNNKETTQREVSDQIKKIDYLIKKNNDQKTIKGLEIELNKEKRNQINNLNELNKIKEEKKGLEKEVEELRSQIEIYKIMTKKEMSIKEDTDCLKNNKEIIKALEEGKEKLEFIKQTYEIEKQNFFLDINDLKKEIIRVNRDNNFLKTVVKDLSMKIDELPERKELIK